MNRQINGLVWFGNLNNLKLAIVMPITSTKSTHHFSVVSLKKGDGGLDKDSYVLCFQIRTISHERIIKTIGELDNFNISKVSVVLSQLLEL